MVDMLLVLDTGTAVTFFFTRNPDLFFAKAMLSLLLGARRKFSGSSDRRVLTFPSGFLLLGLDLNLLVSLGDGRLCLGF